MAGPATELGLDRSGNGNNFAVAGTLGSDQMLDTPTNNFCTVNALDVQTVDKLKEGALQLEPGLNRSRGTMAVTSGKWYFEVLLKDQSSGNVQIGICGVVHKVDTDDNNEFVRLNHPSANGNGVILKVADANTDNQGTVANGNIIGVFFDMDAEEISFLVNNSAIAASCTGVDFSGLTNKDMMAPHLINQNGRRSVVNFGQDSSFAGNKTAQGNQDGNGIGDFYYTPPTGFLALCTKNLPEPAVKPSEYFNTVLYTGNGSDDRSISGVGFQPDLVWIKSRSATTNNYLYDAIRGANKQLLSNADNDEANTADRMQAFESDGFQVGTSSEVNNNSATYVAWNWKANGTGSSNTAGALDSTVSVATDAGFSIVTFTGNGSGTTVGHGLSKAPEIVITKGRNFQDSWHTQVYPAIAATKTLLLDTTGAETTSNAFNNTAPTSSLFSVSTGYASNTRTLVAYCFHSVAGYSKVGLYTGNGSANGSFVNTGFKPMMVISKYTGAENWNIIDTKRSPHNLMEDLLKPDSSAAEIDTQIDIDFLSNGFKPRINSGFLNGNDHKIIFVAFAETPFKYANAR